jgi:AcrR family transcriptional regulator
VDLRIERGRTTRERLIAVGIELFGERGYKGTSIGAILEAAGIARGALYHHFATKAELFDAVLDNVIEQVANAASRAAMTGDNPVDHVRNACASWLDSALDPAVQRIVLLDAPAVLGWDRCRELDERHTLGRLRATLRRIAKSGRLPEEAVNMLAPMLLAAVSEAASLIARAEDQRAAREAGQVALELLLVRLVTPEGVTAGR